MTRINFLSNLFFRYAAMITLLLTLACGNVWADPDRGIWTDDGAYVGFRIDGSSTSWDCNNLDDGGVSDFELGNVDVSLNLYFAWVKTWCKDCFNWVAIYYRVKVEDSDPGTSYSEYKLTWRNDFGDNKKNSYWDDTSNQLLNLSGLEAGDYEVEFYFQANGKDGNDYFLSNSSGNYHANFTLRRKITYHSDGATAGDAPDAEYFSGAATVRDNTGLLRRSDGKVFAGWADSKARADAGNIDHEPGQSNMSVTLTADLDLYPVWKDGYYLITPGATSFNLYPAAPFLTKSSTTGTSITVNEVNFSTKCWQAGSGAKVVGVVYAEGNHIVYDTQTDNDDVFVYAKGTGNLHYVILKDGVAYTAEASDTVAIGSEKVFKFSIAHSKKSRLIIGLSSTTPKIANIKVVKHGSPLADPCTPGYQLSFPGRAGTAKDGTIDGIRLVGNANLTFGTGNCFQPKKQADHYAQFTTTASAVQLQVTTSDADNFYLCTDKSNPTTTGVTLGGSATTHKANLKASTTYYIVPNGNQVDITKIAFANCTTFTAARGGQESGTYTVGGYNGSDLTCTPSVNGFYNYQWKQYVNADPETTTNAVGTGNNTSSFTPNPASAATYYYYCVVTDGCGNAVNTSTTGTFVFNAAPSCSATQPGTISKGTASGGTGIITLTAAGDPATNNTWYWQSAADGTATDLGSGATKDVSATGNYYLRSYCSDNGGCWSDAVSVEVSAEDLLTTPTATFSNSYYIIGGSSLNLSSLWTSDSEGSVTYSVQSAGGTGASISTAAFTATTAGTATVRASQAANGNYSAITKDATITVLPGYATSIDFEAIIDASESSSWKSTMEGRNYKLTQSNSSNWSMDDGTDGTKQADKGLKIKETGDNAGKIAFAVRANQTVELKVGTLAGSNNGKASFSINGGASYSDITGASTASTGEPVTYPYKGNVDRVYVFKTKSSSWNILQHIIIGYKITYDKGANGTGAINPMYKTHGTNITLSSSTFTRDGYTQDGWSTSDGGDKVYDLGGSYTSNAEITLYPHWVGAASISATLESDTYMHTGASGVQIGVEITGASTGWYYRVKKGGGYETPDNTTYTTTTWTMTSTIGAGANTYTVELYNGSGTKMAESNAVTVTGETGHPVTIVAGDNGSVSPSGDVYANGDHLHPTITATPSSGYHFVNWTLSNALATLADASSATTTITNASGACTITAHFEADATLYTVTFNSNGGSAVSPATQASAGASIAKPSDPTRASYEFDGWYATAGEKISWPYTPEADITLYARWEEECDAGGVAKSTTDVAASGYTTYQEVGGSNVVFTSAPSLTFKYKDADGNIVNNSTTAVVRNNAYSCLIKSDSGNKGSIKTNSTFSNVDSISFYFAASDKGACKIAVWYSTDNFSTDSTSLLPATTYGDSNSEFKRKTLAIPAAKKTSALTFKFRFTVTSSGKICYMDSLKVYSSTSGSGTCYHVYYHGNGAESGFVSDTTSYSDGAKATVLSYNDSRYPLTKEGNDFQGWATSAGGSVAYSAGQKITIDGADVHLYAKWATTSSALVTWEKKVNVTTWTDDTTPSTTNPTNIGTIGSSATLIDSPSQNSTKTPQIQLASGASNADKGASFTFSMKSADKVVVPTKVSCEVANVGGDSNRDITYKAVLTDGAGNTYYSTNSICPDNNGTLNPIDFVFSSGLSLRGDITVKVYAWLSGSGNGFSFRMGPDIKFYGTVGDYSCATPSAPTISGVSEYVPGQTITLIASHDGENYDNLTTYTWYEGDTWGSKSKVQNAATGSAGYTFTKASCTEGDAGKYWCEVSNGIGCDAHNSEGYDIIVYPTYSITYYLDGGANPVDPAPKTSYTQFDEDYTLPIPTKDGFVFAGWYGASDFSGLPTVVLGSGSVGNKEYYAKWGETVTVSWTVTKVDGELYRGGGGYSVKAVINEDDWSTGFMDELELTATEGVTLKNIEVSENDESKVQVTADFDITTDLAADATSITFTLDVPADGTYGPKVDEHEEDLTSCAGSSTVWNFAYASDDRPTLTNSNASTEGNKNTLSATTGSGNLYYFAGSSDAFETDKYLKMNGASSGGSVNSRSVYQNRCFYIDITSNGTLTIQQYADNGNGAPKYVVANTRPLQSDYPSSSVAPTTTGGATYEINVTNYSSGTADRIWVAYPTAKAYIISVTWTPIGGGGTVTPTLTWDDGDADIANYGVSKSTSNDDFVYTARQDKNSLGAITYGSSDVTVATVNSTTGQVHLVGAAGTATITATIAASGCFSSANVSYTITVTDDCDDEAGTIETEDLGCSGVKMTITGHTAAAGVIYQWYKVGTPSDATVGTNQDNFTATEAGSYYVIVTNTGDRHCAKRSTNTITVEAQAAATVTKIVDSWYVKKDRRTPDIELVKTTNATSFTVTSGSITIWESAGSIKTGFAGCGFHMGENGIIYLNGTKDNGDAPAHDDGTWAAGDETLTITAIGCGGNASQNITIHKQAATNYKEIAFVADGGKGMRKDSITVGHGDGTELYEYLDSVGTAAGKRLFQLSERNIYWTTDEKAIREEYSRFDAILITDDPSTNTVVKKGDDYKTKGYVNAFGTMVDVRPIFTMEAYVSALKNWGSKGIAGNPESPNPRQYEMRLECKDHEIYGAGLPDPEDGTNVWEEVIAGETFRHVILVDSTKGVYKGVAYNAETAGNQKPALQGFTGEAAGSLLGLGRILEGTLQAAIERQEEPAARLLVMGINAKALQPTCALTNEGKTVIKNILVYLLKTNMEEVDDCSNYFTGKTSTDWNTEANWSKGSLPNYETKVRILAPCEVSGVTAHVAQVDIVSSGESSIRGSHRSGDKTCNGQLTINANGALIVEGKVRTAKAPHFAANELKPTTVNDLVLNTSSANQAALIFNNDEGKTQATVNYYSLGRKDSKTNQNQFQYFAIPMSYLSVNPTFANERHGITIYTYVWLEATGWERRGYYTDLYAFEGIGITTDKTDAHVYRMTGTLASTKDQEIPITADGKKLNLIGNSWTAPIQISELEASDFGDASSAVEQTVYIYCAGHGKETADGKTEAAGQWLAIPFEATRFDAWDGLKVIPSMQAFQIKTRGEGTLTLDYDKHVRGGSTDLTAKLRAPQRRAAHDGVELMRIRVADSKTHTDLYLFEGDQFSDAFDNGWEANYRVGTNESAKLYARVATGVMSVAAMSDLEGTPIYFIPGQETEYTFTFGGNGMGYYLNDLKLQQSTLINEGAEYSFTYEKGDAAARFMISATPYESPQVTTGTENVQTEDKPRKILYNNKLYIIYNGHVYSADGAIVK